MEIGNLYQVKQYFWLLFPSKDIAVTAARTDAAVAPGSAAAASSASASAANWANYWSGQLSCNVSYISPNSLFMLLEQDGKYYKVLSTEGMVGWIYFPEWCKEHIEHIAEVKAE